MAEAALHGRTRRALGARLSSGHVVMLLAGALGVLLTLSVLRTADDKQPVLVAARDLAPGSVIADGDVRVAHMKADAAVLSTLFDTTDVAGVRGQVVTSTIEEGALVERADVHALGDQAATRVMSFPLDRSRAVGGKLTSGDRVDVVAVERNSARSGYVLVDAEVIGVDTADSGALSSGDDEVTVSLVVDAEGARRLAAALEAGSVTLVRATGAPPLADPPLFTPAEPIGE
jgi:Flp pilus assembly protein CpaB